MAFITAKNYQFAYSGQERKTLNIDLLQIEKGSFTLLSGASGSGKTTLLRHIAKETGWAGEASGELHVEAEKIGYVWQNPQSQVVTDQVEYEIAFGLENMGMPVDQMKRRIAEMVTFFGLEDLLNRDTFSLSGGELQIVHVAAAIAMNPDLLLLDEPTSKLDPMATKRLLELLHRINEELGITIVLAEQRVEDVILLCDKVILLEQGEIAAQGDVNSLFQNVRHTKNIHFFPEYIQLFSVNEPEGECPLSLKEARRWFERNYSKKESAAQENKNLSKRDSMECKNLFFRYERASEDVLRDLTTVFPLGEIICLAGGNGSGKTTLLEILSGRYRPYRGKCKRLPKSSRMLPQEPTYLFLKETVKEELMHQPAAVLAYMKRFDMEQFGEHNPLDLSGGEKQRLALSLILGQETELYLLDEPTTGLDYHAKQVLGEILLEKKNEGRTIIMVSHDMEFTARYADQMALMFHGDIALSCDKRQFFEENQFYTTGVNRMTREVSAHILIQEDVQQYAEKKHN